MCHAMTIKGFESNKCTATTTLENLTDRASECVQHIFKVNSICDSYATGDEKHTYKLEEVDITDIRFAFNAFVDLSGHNFNILIDFKLKNEKPPQV